ncbi:MAG: nitroreductase [Bacteriovoracaceae bacterium]|nr:nitroreductase [Bacteriovoracaceae bacterium]
MHSSEHLSAEFQTVSAIIRKRRTCKDFDGKPVEKELIEALLELAVWAPNHGLTEPWRFRVLLHSGLKNWIKFFQDELREEDLVPFEKTFEKILKAGAIIHVSHLSSENETVQKENSAATCAAIQNILLAATAQHLQSYWSTSKIFNHAKTNEFLNISHDENFVGAIWLGHGQIPAPKPRKLAREKTLWIK